MRSPSRTNNFSCSCYCFCSFLFCDLDPHIFSPVSENYLKKKTLERMRLKKGILTLRHLNIYCVFLLVGKSSAIYTPSTRRKCSTKSVRCRYVTWPYTRTATRRRSGSRRVTSAFLPGWILYGWRSLSDWHRRLALRARTRHRHWRWWGVSLRWTLARISTSSVIR